VGKRNILNWQELHCTRRISARDNTLRQIANFQNPASARASLVLAKHCFQPLDNIDAARVHIQAQYLNVWFTHGSCDPLRLVLQNNNKDIA